MHVVTLTPFLVDVALGPEHWEENVAVELWTNIDAATPSTHHLRRWNALRDEATPSDWRALLATPLPTDARRFRALVLPLAAGASACR